MTADKKPDCPDWLAHGRFKAAPMEPATAALLMVDMCPSVRRPHFHRSVTLECLPDTEWEYLFPDSGPLRLALVLNSGDIVWRNTTHLNAVSLERLPSDELLYKRSGGES